MALLASCGGAGIATAFNAPIAGSVFVLEELIRRFDTRVAIAALGSSCCAIAVARLFLGRSPDFLVPPSAVYRSWKRPSLPDTRCNRRTARDGLQLGSPDRYLCRRPAKLADRASRHTDRSCGGNRRLVRSKPGRRRRQYSRGGCCRQATASPCFPSSSRCAFSSARSLMPLELPAACLHRCWF